MLLGRKNYQAKVLTRLYDSLLTFIAAPTKAISNLTKESNRSFYQKEEDYDWVQAVESFVGLESIFHRLRQRVIIQTIDKYRKSGRFLDAGCGTGLVLRHLPKGSVGLDINPRHIVKSKKHAPQKRYVVADIYQIPFKDSYFSNIVCTEVLEHVLDPSKALRELARVLKPGGVIIGTVPGRSFFWRLRFLSKKRPQEPYHRYFREHEIVDLLERNKLEVIHLTRQVLAMEIVFVAKK